jgi:hypothetical protein
MARLLPRTTYLPRSETKADYGRLLLLAAQYAVIVGIAVYLIIAIVNTIFGVPTAEAPYSPYDGS